MSTTTATPTGLTITRAERDSLHDRLHFQLDADPPDLDADSLRDFARRTELRIAFCDALGWEEKDDRDSYRLPSIPVEELRHWLTRWRDAAAEMAAYEVRDADKVAAGDEMHFTSATGADTLRDVRDAADNHLTTAITCMDLLDRLAA